MNTTRQQMEFLLDNYDMFIERLCFSYPFTLDMLRQYKDVLDWTILSHNEQLPWSLDMMLEFESYLDFGAGDTDLETKWINLNQGIPWDSAILAAFEDRWQWRELAANPLIRKNSTLRLRFFHRLAPFISEISEDYILDDESQCYEESGEDEYDDIELMLLYIEGLDDCPELCYHTIEEIEAAARELNWERLSENTYLPWSIELIERYKEQWDWAALSANESLPWSSQLIAHFEDQWVWGGLGPANEQGDRLVEWGITSNEAIHWTSEMLERFCDKHDWFHISYASKVDWTIDVLYQFQEHLDYEQVLFSDPIWNMVCNGCVSYELIDRVMCVAELEDAICLN